MPAVAVIPAVAAIGLAGAGLATAGLTIGTGLAIAGAIGATIGAIGSLTGNKTLGIAGMALGAVGAIGGVAGMAGAFDGIGGAAGGIGGAAGGIDSEIANWSTYGSTAGTMGPSGEMGGQVAAGQGLWGQDAISSITGTAPPPDTLPTMTGPTGLGGQPITQGEGGGTLGTQGNPADPASSNYSGVSPGAMPGPPGGATAGTPAPGAAASPYQSTIDPVTGAATTTIKPGMAQPTTPLSTTPAGSWSGIMDFIEKHPALALSGITAASSFLSGAFNPKTPAEVNALNAQAAKSQADVGLIGAQTGLINTQQANASQIPTATRTRTVRPVGAPA